MEIFIGLFIISVWAYSSVIIAQKTKNTTQIEKVVLVMALVGFVLFIIGASSN